MKSKTVHEIRQLVQRMYAILWTRNAILQKIQLNQQFLWIYLQTGSSNKQI